MFAVEFLDVFSVKGGGHWLDFPEKRLDRLEMLRIENASSNGSSIGIIGIRIPPSNRCS